MSIYASKSIPQLKLIAEKHFNAFIRQRDNKGGYFVCISCNKPKRTDSGQYHAGHYLSAGHHSYTKFNEQNVNGQCAHCNTFLHGNLINYRKGLIRKIGLVAVEQLESFKHYPMKWDRFELIGVIELYMSKIKQAA